MKDRTEPCIHYTNAHGECRKGYKYVTLKKCKNCTRYHARKAAHRNELSATGGGRTGNGTDSGTERRKMMQTVYSFEEAIRKVLEDNLDSFLCDDGYARQYIMQVQVGNGKYVYQLACPHNSNLSLERWPVLNMVIGGGNAYLMSPRSTIFCPWVQENMGYLEYLSQLPGDLSGRVHDLSEYKSMCVDRLTHTALEDFLEGLDLAPLSDVDLDIIRRNARKALAFGDPDQEVARMKKMSFPDLYNQVLADHICGLVDLEEWVLQSLEDSRRAWQRIKAKCNKFHRMVSDSSVTMDPDSLAIATALHDTDAVYVTVTFRMGNQEGTGKVAANSILSCIARDDGIKATAFLSPGQGRQVVQSLTNNQDEGIPVSAVCRITYRGKALYEKQ